VDVDLVISVPPEHKVQAALIGEAWGLEADSCQSFSSGWTHIAAGPIVDEFIKRFDQGNYPHLSEAIL